ncbi:MAG: CoA transferase [Deltaproteobacteria bacterium]|nr:CoA transferase [Deltaproteobacteria bacterium]
MRSELMNGLRMLDLTDEKGAICGKMFADMGAEVIKVEPPQGCSTRKIPPFLDDEPDLEHSLHFLAYQAGKQSITLNLESADGRELLKELVKRSDFLVESFPLDHAVRRQGSGQGLQGSRYRFVGVRRRDVHDGRRGQAAASDDCAAGLVARGGRGCGRFDDRALRAPDRRHRPAYRRERAGLCGVDVDE